MSKHHNHHVFGYGHASISCSDSSDEEFRHLPKHERERLKKLKKEMRKGHIPPRAIPDMHVGMPLHMPHHGMPHHSMPHHSMPHHGMPHHGMPHHGMPHHGMLHHGMLHHGMPHHSGACGIYPTQPQYPAAGGYPVGAYSGGGSYPVGMVPPPVVYPGQAPRYPAGQVPVAYPPGPGGYPSQHPY